MKSTFREMEEEQLESHRDALQNWPEEAGSMQEQNLSVDKGNKGMSLLTPESKNISGFAQLLKNSNFL